MKKIKEYVKILQECFEKNEFLESMDIIGTDYNYYIFEKTKGLENEEREAEMYRLMKNLNRRMNFIYKYAHEKLGLPEMKKDVYINRNVQVSISQPELHGFYCFLNKYFKDEIEEFSMGLSKTTEA